MPQSKKGTQLKPSTVQTTLDQIEFQRVNRPSWVAYHFPAVDRRGRVEYGDIEAMTEREADSIRHLLASQISWGTKQAGRQRGRGVGLIRDDNEDSGTGEWVIRVRQMREALEDLCAVFGMPMPL